MHFKSYITLYEKKREDRDGKKVAVFTFGRFGPPTKGHERLILSTIKEAERLNADHFIFPSQTTGKKNPLPFDVKVSFMKTLFPSANIVVDRAIKNPFDTLEWFDKRGYTDLVFVVGSDRVNEFETRLKKYAIDLFSSIEIVNAGARDPDGEGISGMSATKARAAASDNNIAKFRAATGWGGDVSIDLMKAVRKGMGAE